MITYQKTWPFIMNKRRARVLNLLATDGIAWADGDSHMLKRIFQCSQLFYFFLFRNDTMQLRMQSLLTIYFVISLKLIVSFGLINFVVALINLNQFHQHFHKLYTDSFYPRFGSKIAGQNVVNCRNKANSNIPARQLHQLLRRLQHQHQHHRVFF